MAIRQPLVATHGSMAPTLRRLPAAQKAAVYPAAQPEVLEAHQHPALAQPNTPVATAETEQRQLRAVLEEVGVVRQDRPAQERTVGMVRQQCQQAAVEVEVQTTEPMERAVLAQPEVLEETDREVLVVARRHHPELLALQQLAVAAEVQQPALEASPAMLVAQVRQVRSGRPTAAEVVAVVARLRPAICCQGRAALAVTMARLVVVALCTPQPSGTEALVRKDSSSSPTIRL